MQAQPAMVLPHGLGCSGLQLAQVCVRRAHLPVLWPAGGSGGCRGHGVSEKLGGCSVAHAGTCLVIPGVIMTCQPLPMLLASAWGMLQRPACVVYVSSLPALTAVSFWLAPPLNAGGHPGAARRVHGGGTHDGPRHVAGESWWIMASTWPTLTLPSMVCMCMPSCGSWLSTQPCRWQVTGFLILGHVNLCVLALTA